MCVTRVPDDDVRITALCDAALPNNPHRLKTYEYVGLKMTYKGFFMHQVFILSIYMYFNLIWTPYLHTHFCDFALVQNVS